MTSEANSDIDLVGFAQGILGLLERGKFTSTYKYAVILALTDLCLEHTTKAGSPPSILTARQLAEKSIEL